MDTNKVNHEPLEEDILAASEINSDIISRDNPYMDCKGGSQLGFLAGFTDGYSAGIKFAKHEIMLAINRKDNLIKSYELRLKELLEKFN